MLPSSRRTKVLMARRFCGAVAMTEKSRMPSSDMPSVRGMGVAVSVSTSTSARRALSASFWRTPKRCSSSMITRPRRLNFTSLDRILWVPMTMSTRPSLMPSMAADTSLGERKRDSSTTRTGQSAKRSEKVCACCSASSVVGHSSATCLPLATARKAARNATSVLPKPTSPQTSRSIGRPEVMSPITASMAAAWSAVSSKPKPSANAS
ncbi:hypothetical protein D3C85_1126810 [compost metagenome]